MNLDEEKQARLKEIWPEVAQNMDYRGYVQRWLDANKAMNVAALQWQEKRRDLLDAGGLMSQEYFKSKDQETVELRRLQQVSSDKLSELLALETVIKDHLDRLGLL